METLLKYNTSGVECRHAFTHRDCCRYVLFAYTNTIIKLLSFRDRPEPRNITRIASFAHHDYEQCPTTGVLSVHYSEHISSASWQYYCSDYASRNRPT